MLILVMSRGRLRGIAPQGVSCVYFFALLFTSHRSALSERLEQAIYRTVRIKTVENSKAVSQESFRGRLRDDPNCNDFSRKKFFILDRWSRKWSLTRGGRTRMFDCKHLYGLLKLAKTRRNDVLALNCRLINRA